MKGDELEPKFLCNFGDFLDSLPVGFPVLVGQDATGFLDGFERCVVLADRAEHAGNDFDPCSGEYFRRFLPRIRVVAEWIKG